MESHPKPGSAGGFFQLKLSCSVSLLPKSCSRWGLQQSKKKKKKTQSVGLLRCIPFLLTYWHLIMNHINDVLYKKNTNKQRKSEAPKLN